MRKKKTKTTRPTSGQSIGNEYDLKREILMEALLQDSEAERLKRVAKEPKRCYLTAYTDKATGKVVDIEVSQYESRLMDLSDWLRLGEPEKEVSSCNLNDIGNRNPSRHTKTTTTNKADEA